MLYRYIRTQPPSAESLRIPLGIPSEKSTNKDKALKMALCHIYESSQSQIQFEPRGITRVFAVLT